MTNRGRYITIGSVALMSLVKRPSHVVPLRPCAIRTLLTDLSHLPGFQYGTLARLRWNSVFANAHRNVYNNFGLARSDKIMGGLRLEDVEAFLHVTMVAITLTGI